MIWRLSATVHRDHPHFADIPAEERYPHQFALENIDRVRHARHEGVGVPERLVLGRDDAGGVGDMFQSLDCVIAADNDFLQPKVRARPVFRDEPRLLALGEKIDRRQHDHLDDEAEIEGDIEDQGADENHWEIPCIAIPLHEGRHAEN
jgi:hypothetical protein